MTPGPGAKWSEMAFVRHGPLSYPPHLTANKETKNTPRKPGDLGRRQNRHKRRNIRRAARPGQRRPFPEEAPGPARPRPAPPPHPQPERPRADPRSSAPGDPLFLSESYPPAACTWQ